MYEVDAFIYSNFIQIGIHILEEVLNQNGYIDYYKKDQISDLDNPDKLEIVLRERGYGKEGEILFVYDIPEPVTPIEEVINNDRSKSVFEYVVEFIVGQEGG